VGETDFFPLGLGISLMMETSLDAAGGAVVVAGVFGWRFGVKGARGGGSWSASVNNEINNNW
jgi:hypothetical protein